MISKFDKLILATTVVSPLLLSLAIVVIALYPTEYTSAWADLLCDNKTPGLVWMMVNAFIFVFLFSLLGTVCILSRSIKNRKAVKSIRMTSLQPKTFNVSQVIAMMAPWATLLFKGEDSPVVAILILTAAIALVICIVLSNHGYISLVIMLLGFNCYEGRTANGMSITLLSKRQWGSASDICQIVPLTNEMALIV